MDNFVALTVEEFLDRVAERTPTPGGGGVTATAGALSCALARMVAAYSVNRNSEAPIRTQIQNAAACLEQADRLLRELIARDARAYRDMVAAGRDAKADTGRQPLYQEAVLAAISIPVEMAAVACDALEAMDQCKAAVSRYLISDLGVASVLAEATARAAWYSVRVNARELDEDTIRDRVMTEIDDLLAHCARFRESIESLVRPLLEA